jgi:hypothetical protein
MNFGFKLSLLALLVFQIKTSTQVKLFISNIAIPFLNMAVLTEKVCVLLNKFHLTTNPVKVALGNIRGFAVLSAIKIS